MPGRHTPAIRIMHNFASNLKYVRKQFSISQTDIANLVKKGQTTVVYWEGGKTEPGIEALVTLSKYFGISLDAFILNDLSVSGILTDDHIKKFKATRKSHPGRVGTVSPLADKTWNHVPDVKGKKDTPGIEAQLQAMNERLSRIEKSIKKNK